MGFLNPMAFVGLLAIPLIVLMYLLKQKYKDTEFSSLLLWQRAVQLSLSQRPWQKLRRNVLMALQILIAFLFVFALAEPFFARSTQIKSYILVLDTSLSMQATDVSPSRFEAAKKRVLETVTQAEPETEIAVVTLSKNPTVAIPFSRDKRAIAEQVKGIPVGFTHTTPEALAQADTIIQMLKEQNNAKVYLFSDQIYDEWEAEPVLVGGPVNNVAITLVSHVIELDRIVSLVKLRNFGDTDKTVDLAVYTDDSLLDTKRVDIGANQYKDVFFTSLPRETKRLTAKLLDDDVLLADNYYYDAIHETETKKVLLVTEQNVFLENILSLLDNIELYKSSGVSDDSELKGYYLYIFDGVLPDVLPTDGHIFVINPPVGNSLIETAEDVDIQTITKGRNTSAYFLRYITEPDFVVQKAKKIVPPQDSDIILTSEATPLLVARETNGHKELVIAFDLHDSDLPLKREFPVFVYNIISWFTPPQLFEGNPIVSGDSVRFHAYPDAQKISVVNPIEKVEVLAPPFPMLEYAGTEATGYYILEQRLPEDTVFDWFAVNTDASESDLQTVGGSATGDPSDGLRMGFVNQSLSFVILLVVLLITFIEWWVYNRGH